MPVIEHRRAGARPTTSTTSASRIEPPGWAKAVTPAARQTSTASANGKKASDAHDEPRERRVARVGQGLRDGAAGGVHPGRLARAHPDQPPIAHEHDRVRHDAAAQPPGEVEVQRRSASVGARREATVQVDGSSGRVSGAVTSTAPPAVRIEPERIGAVRAAPSLAELRRPRRAGGWAFAARIASASGSKAGATTTSRKIDDSAAAVAASTGRVSATTPPNADTGIAGQRRLPGLEERRALGGAARVRVLDDDAGRAAQRSPEGRRRRGVQDVVVRQRLALERRRIGRERAVLEAVPGPSVAGGRLVRVLAVAQGVDLLEGDRQAVRDTGRLRAGRPGSSGQRDAGRRHPAGQDLGDPGVVGRGVAEGLDGQRRSEAVVDRAAVVDGAQDRVVARRRRDDRDVGVVLGGRADHRRAADVDLLDERIEGDARALRGRRRTGRG